MRIVRRLTFGALLGLLLSIAAQQARLRGLLRPARKHLGGDDSASIPSDPSDRLALEALTKEELYARAQKKGVRGRSEMTKEELIDALRSRQRSGNE